MGTDKQRKALLKRMIADGRDTYAKKVAWVRRHLPQVTDPAAFVGWVVAKHRNPAPRVGKLIGGNLYVHRSALRTLPVDVQDRIAKARPPFSWAIAKWNTRTGQISLIDSPDWDTADEPISGSSYQVETGKITKQGADPWIYHHKWQFVAPDYKGFDVAQSKARSKAWESVAGVDKSRIGKQSYWQREVVPLIPNPAAPPPRGFERYRVVSSSIGADAVTHKKAMLYSVRAPDGRTGNLIPHAGVYRFHEQLDLFGAPREELVLTAPTVRGGSVSPTASAQSAQLGLFANPRKKRNPQRRVSIAHGELYAGDWNPDEPNYFKSEKYTLLDPQTKKPVPDLTYEGPAWTDPFDDNFLSLDDPRTVARPRMVTIGKQTKESKEYGKGYDSGYFGKRALSDDALRSKTAAFADGYFQGRKDRPDAGKKRNPKVLTGDVREMPDGGLGIKTYRQHGGKRKAEWLPVPAGLEDWRAELAAGKRLSQPAGLRRSPLVQQTANGVVSEAIAPNGAKVWVAWQVVDLSALRTSHDPWTLQVNSAYPQELQPRDRSRKSYADQIGRLVAQFDPSLLVWSATISDGAPIVGTDGVVESGNGRTMALSRVYRTGGAKADQYRDAVKLWAAELGVPMPKVPHPVLVRVRQTDVDRAEFARMANVSAMQLMSAGEQAVADAASMTADLILQLDPDRSVGAGANSSFVDGFIAQVAGRTARGQLVDEKGRLSKSGENRIDLAIFAFAYGAEAQILINELAEVRESDLRTALSGMLEGAAHVARLRAGIAQGLYHAQHDPADGLVHMATFVRAAKLAGQTVDQRLAQSTMFEPLPRTAELWLQALRPKGSRLSAAALAAAIVAYCQWVDLYPAGQASMFDDAPPAQEALIERSLRGGPQGGE